MPHPSKERNKFIAQGVEEIKQILEISKGKALILFTAKSSSAVSGNFAPALSNTLWL